MKPIFELATSPGQPDETIFYLSVPTLQSVLHMANRLLKFRFPPHRNPALLQEFVHRWIAAPKPPLTTLQTLPLQTLEGVVQVLWKECLNAQQADNSSGGTTTRFPLRKEPGCLQEEALATTLILAEELLQFNASAWGREDLGQLETQRSFSDLHASHFANENVFSTQTLQVILQQHHQPTQYIIPFNPGEESCVDWEGYLHCRAMSHPLPWQLLLEIPTENELQHYPRLFRLKRCLEWLQQLPPAKTFIHSPPAEKRRMLQILSRQFCREFPQYQPPGKPRPLQEVVIVEGNTEELLLPFFALQKGISFDALGIQVLPAGGKNQVMSLYNRLSKEVSVPIFVLLDYDAARQASTLETICRPEDRIVRFEEGEWEDAYDLPLLLHVINQEYQPYPQVTETMWHEWMEAEEKPPKSTIHRLKIVWKHCGLGTFDKSLFARNVLNAFPAETPEISLPKTLDNLLQGILALHPTAKL